MTNPKMLRIESKQSYEEGADFVPDNDGGLVISVAEEHAVDSYNDTFECKITMSREQVIQLRDWINSTFAEASKP